MGTIGHRDRGTSVTELARASYDVAIVGGGIYGAMLQLEASRAGLRSVLVERGDFGGATSEASLRIVHGGLRYLRGLNVARSVESTRERQWYAASMPQLVASLPCLLPIYERAGSPAAVLELGLAANDILGAAVRYLDGMPADVMKEYASLEKGMHANAAETSAVLRINPDLVDMERANAEFPPFPEFKVNAAAVHTAFFFSAPGSVYFATKSGTWGDARNATAEMGERYLEASVASTIAVLENIEETFKAMPVRS